MFVVFIDVTSTANATTQTLNDVTSQYLFLLSYASLLHELRHISCLVILFSISDLTSMLTVIADISYLPP